MLVGCCQILGGDASLILPGFAPMCRGRCEIEYGVSVGRCGRVYEVSVDRLRVWEKGWRSELGCAEVWEKA